MLSDRELQMRINKFLARKTDQYPDLLDSEEVKGRITHSIRPLYT